MPVELLNHNGEAEPVTIEMPAPTQWPIVLAFGLALLFAGFATSDSVGVLGAVLSVAGAVGWFRDVLPHEAHESLRVSAETPRVITLRHEVAQMGVVRGLRRAWLPVETYPISAGVKGGLAGCVAMAVVAMLYGLVSQHSIWYPINLLVAGFFPRAITYDTAVIAAFHMNALLMAIALHLLTSLLVGLLYGAMLPMFPRRPILLGGFIAPFLWTGLIHSILGIVNPVLNQRIHWVWFVASQVAFGIVAGVVVSRQGRIRTLQQMPFALRIGMEGSGLTEENRGENERP
jgi:hypothetical protein